MSNPFNLYDNSGSSSGMASSLSNFGLGSNRTASASVPKATLPTTAGDLNQPGSMFSIGQGFMDQSNKAMNAAGAFDYDALGGFGKTFRNRDGSFDLGAAGSVLQGLGGLGSLYLGFQANKTAKDTLDFKKQSYEENMANQISSFNMALEDKARSRAVQANQAPGEADAYINKHKL